MKKIFLALLLISVAACVNDNNTRSATKDASERIGNYHTSPTDLDLRSPSEATITWENGELGISVLGKDGRSTEFNADQMDFHHDWATVEEDKIYGSWNNVETSVNLRSFDGGEFYFGRLMYFKAIELTLACNKREKDKKLKEFRLDCYVPLVPNDRHVQSFVAALENGEAYVDIKMSDGTTLSPIGEEATGVIHTLKHAKASWDMGEHWMDLRSIDNGQTFGGIFVLEQDFSYFMICKSSNLSVEPSEYTLRCENAVDALATTLAERPHSSR